MKAIVLTEKGDWASKKWGKLDCVDIPMPQIVHDDDVLIKVAYASICGSDPNMLNGIMDVPVGIGFGHEMSGTVVALGPGCTHRGLKVGDKVTGCFVHFCGICDPCRRGMEQFCTSREQNIVPCQAEYVVWSEDQVYKLPDDADLKCAALIEPMTIALHSVEKAHIRMGDHVAVSGGGGIGLMVVELCKMAGAGKVTLLEPVEAKRELSLTLGADYALDSTKPDFQEKRMEIAPDGFDEVIECSGNRFAAQTALEITKKGGTMVYMAQYPTDFRLPLDLSTYLYHHELTLTGLFLSTYSFGPAIRMLSRMNLEPIIQREYKLEECQQAYADQISGKFAKIVFNCDCSK